MSIPLTTANFFQSILSHKNWRGGGELLLKNVQYIVTPTNRVIARAGFTLSWANGTLGYLQYFRAKCRSKPKKFLSERGIMPYVKSVPGYRITLIKKLDEDLS